MSIEGRLEIRPSFLSVFRHSAHHRRNPGMFKGIGALPQRAQSGWVYTQTLLAQNVPGIEIENLKLAELKSRLKK